MRHFVGCTGWRFAAREPGCYPASLDPKEYLSYYSRVFDFVEVGLPAIYRFSLARWARQTPEGFRFAISIPRQVADDGSLGQDRLFYCDLCNTLFLSEADAQGHERLSGHSTVQPTIVLD